MSRSLTLLFAFLLSAAAEAGTVRQAAQRVGEELKQYARDARSLATAPLRWDRDQWQKAGLITAGLAATFALDDEIRETVQDNRSEFTEDLSDVVTPWGGRRAEYVAIAFIAGGAFSNNVELRDTGRDALEATILAGRITTPLLKTTIGRSRPFENEGTYEFDPFSENHSFPSGHATNAFALASVIADHSDRRSVRIFVYSMATAVAFARVHDDVHFGSDVFAGGIIGTSIGRGIVARHPRGSGQPERLTVTPALLEDGFALNVRWSWP